MAGPSDPARFWFSTHDSRLDHYEADWRRYQALFGQLAAIKAGLDAYVGLFDATLGQDYGFIEAGILKQVPGLDPGRFAAPPPGTRLAIEQGEYVALPHVQASFPLIAQALAPCIDDSVDCIVEFGSGIGTNLARLRLRHPGRDITYIACEPTEIGRATTAMLFAADPAMRTRVLHFDYTVADLDFLKDYHRPVAFTNHSIEQVATVGAPFYARLLRSPVAACAHLEPVGWQRYDNVRAVVLAMYRDPAFFKATLDRHGWSLDDARLIDNAAMWAARHAYNVDLLPTVAAAAKADAVTLTALAYDVTGLNPFNPSTLIAWRR